MAGGVAAAAGPNSAASENRCAAVSGTGPDGASTGGGAGAGTAAAGASASSSSSESGASSSSAGGAAFSSGTAASTAGTACGCGWMVRVGGCLRSYSEPTRADCSRSSCVASMISLSGGARGGGGANPPFPPRCLASAAAPPPWKSAPPCMEPKRPTKPTEGDGATPPAPAAEAAGRDGVGNVLGTTSSPAEAPGSCVVSPLASGGALTRGNAPPSAMMPTLLRGWPSGSTAGSSLRCGSGGVGLGGLSAGSGSGGRPAAARASDAASEARGVPPSPPPPAPPVAPGVGAVGKSATAGESSSPPSPPDAVSHDKRLRGTERSADATPASPSNALPPRDSAAPPDARPKAQSSTLRGD